MDSLSFYACMRHDASNCAEPLKGLVLILIDSLIWRKKSNGTSWRNSKKRLDPKNFIDIHLFKLKKSRHRQEASMRGLPRKSPTSGSEYTPKEVWIQDQKMMPN
jgi:hypothetical protein